MSEPSSHPLAAVGWSDRVQARSSLLPRPDGEPARVVGVERGWSRIATVDGEQLLPVTDLAVGDWVVLRDGAVVDVVPRWSELARLDGEQRRQVLAANVDLVLVAAPGDRTSLARLERECVIAWDSGARPVVVLTKLDLAPAGLLDELGQRLGTVDVVATSVASGEGVAELAEVLVAPVTAVLLGPSGAGKSSLVNALLGEARLPVGDVRAVDRRGRHTTTSRRLTPLPSGGSLIDMPGLRSLGTSAGADAVAATFPDIDALADGCRFADCAHDTEPGCAVVAALASGTLDPARLESFRKLERATAYEGRRTDPVERAAQTKVWKARTKDQRRRYEERGR